MLMTVTCESFKYYLMKTALTKSNKFKITQKYEVSINYWWLNGSWTWI